MVKDHMKWAFIGKLFFSLLLTLGGGMISGSVTRDAVLNWYPSIIKPEGTPPPIAFPIAWTVLYILMAISLTFFWDSKTKNKKLGALFFFIQLFFNFLWSTLFFYLQNPLMGVIDIFLIILFTILTINQFWRHSKWASVLLMPYLIWISYAFYLNLFIWIYN
jgi:benzodiazapine receptor